MHVRVRRAEWLAVSVETERPTLEVERHADDITSGHALLVEDANGVRLAVAAKGRRA
jgi:hypothetical protein